jgi:DNA-binding beta-propeller fold protein YncE
MLALPGSPFAVLSSGDGDHVVVSLSTTGQQGRLAVMASGQSPSLLFTVALPGNQATGMALSHDGKLLLVTLGDGVAVVDMARLVSRAGEPVLGVLHDNTQGAVEVAFSADDRYAFVAEENSANLSVYDLRVAATLGFAAPGVDVGTVALGPGLVGLALSGDGQWLYAVTEGSRDTASGMLWVIDVDRAERHAANPVAAQLQVGCQPVRLVLSSDGRTAWISDRGSDAVVAVDTTALTDRAPQPIRNVVLVGSAPVGLLLLDADRQLLVANSNRFATDAAPQTVAIIDTNAALAGKPALSASVPAGAFPREFGYNPITHQVMLTNFSSNTLETITLPTP